MNAVEERHDVEIDELTAEVIEELSAEREVLSEVTEVMPIANVAKEPVIAEVCLREAPTTSTAFMSVKDVKLSRERRWLKVERETEQIE